MYCAVLSILQQHVGELNLTAVLIVLMTGKPERFAAKYTWTDALLLRLSSETTSASGCDPHKTASVLISSCTKTHHKGNSKHRLGQAVL